MLTSDCATPKVTMLDTTALVHECYLRLVNSATTPSIVRTSGYSARVCARSLSICARATRRTGRGKRKAGSMVRFAVAAADEK